MTYRFLHLSDIHFGQERNGKVVIHDDVREELLRDCRSQSEPKALGPADGILVTGDTAFRGKQEEYKRAGEWLDCLTDAIHCSKIAVSIIPGNHDVDHDRIGYVGGLVHDKLRNAPLNGLDAHLEEIAKENEENNPLLPKFAAYRAFAAGYGCDFMSAPKPIWQKDYSLGDPYTLRFVGLNSVQVSGKRDTVGQMILGNNQYVIPREDNIEYVVMVHHPLHWFRDHVKAEQYLQRARVLMVGHEHRLEVRKIINDIGLERLEIYAGATNPPEDSDFYPYRYNWIEFELQSGADRCHLIVRVHPRVWEPSHTSFVPDRARLNGEVTKEFSLACTNFDAPAAVQSAAGTSVAPDVVKKGPARGNSQMTQDESEQFARLRYFFWRFLDWPERLKVLVQLDILPSTTSQPVPQTMERLALDAARDQGKLHDLWSAVMEMVPEGQREANPFTANRR